MRRKDREMDRAFGEFVIDSAVFGSLAVYDEKLGITNLPLSIIRIEDNLYFHSAKVGEKVDFFKSNPTVCISFVTDVKVPNNYSAEELESFKTDKSRAKDLISNVFTTEFASCVVRGNIGLVEDEKEKIEAMRIICEKYTPDKMEFFNMAIEAGLSRVNIYKINTSNLTSKRKKYNSKGIELKYMEKE